MQNYGYFYRPAMPMTGMPCQCTSGMCSPGMCSPGMSSPAMSSPAMSSPNMSSPDQQLENMYPNTYRIVYPAVASRCDAMDAKHGAHFIPSNEEFNTMVDNIVSNVEGNVENQMKQNPRGDRQLGFGGRAVLRDLVGILLVRELLSRRRPYYAFPYGGGYGPGFGPGFGGGYIY